MPASFTLIIDGQPKLGLTVPTSWADVTTAQYLALQAPAAPWLAVLTGLAPAQVASLSEDAAALLTDRLAFAFDAAPLRELLPTPNLYEVGNCLYGLLLRFEQFLGQHPAAPALTYGAYLCALYQNPVLPSLLDEPALAAAHAAVLATPITETFADAQHLLASYARAQDGSTRPGPRQPGGRELATPAPTPRSWWARLRLRLQQKPLLSLARAGVLVGKPAALASTAPARA